MNNKYLAIALSVIAVIVVVYQVFLREDEDQIKQNNQIIIPVNKVQKPDTVQNSSGIVAEQKTRPANSKMIDIYSPQLLEKVKAYIDNSKIEIKGNYGKNFFRQEKKKKKELFISKKEIKIPKLTLNGIIEIIKNKKIVAIINNKIYRKGESVENALVFKIEKNKVFLKFNEETIILNVDHGSYKGWIRKKLEVIREL